MNEKWDRRFMDVARLTAGWSKDPSTKCGSIIVDQDRHIISHGYNGLPKWMPDNPDVLNNREEKYKYVIHAERNAIDNCPSSVEGCTLYVTHPCCEVCAAYAIEKGIVRVVMDEGAKDFIERWNCKDAMDLFKASKVYVTMITSQP